jgi:hypothetical protein
MGLSKDMNFPTCAPTMVFSQGLKGQSSRSDILSALNASSLSDWTARSNVPDLSHFALPFNGAADTPF